MKPPNKDLVKRVLLAVQSTSMKGGGIASTTRNLIRIFCEHVDHYGSKFLIFALKDRPEEMLQPSMFHNDRMMVKAYANKKLRFFFDIAFQLTVKKYDIVFFDHVNLAPIGYLLKLTSKLEYVILLHCIEISKLPWLRLKALKGANLLLANSGFSASMVQKLYGDLPTIKIVPPGTEEREISKSTSRNSTVALTDCPYFLIVGRMSSTERYKGHDRVIEAISILHSNGVEVNLAVVGEGDDKLRLMKIANKLGVSDYVKFLGFVPQDGLQKLYGKCTGFVMPSTGEGFGLAYIEAMAKHKPCIGCKGSPAEEIIVEGKTGFLVSPSDTSELADRMFLLLKDPILTKCLGDNGFRRYSRYYTYQAFRNRVKAALGLTSAG